MKIKTLVVNKNVLLKKEIIISFCAFLIPFFLAGPQLLIGIFINSILFISALKFQQRYLYSVICLPSVGALFHGVLFGGLTPFLVYFLPFIWIGNLILVKVFIYKLNLLSYFTRILLASLAKSFFLFLSANVFFHFHLIPNLFLNAMGLMQLLTAMGGGLIAFMILKKLNG